MKAPADLDQMIREIDQHGMRAWLIQEFTRAFREARKHKLKTFNEHSYEVHWSENIVRLVDAVLERYYRPSGSISFVIFDPMVREIFAAPFVDRVIHHFLYNMQAGWWDHRFIADSYSCREDKGTLYGILRTHQMMRSATRGFKEPAYIIKLDIRGYFMSLPRQKLFERVKWGLEQQFRPYFKSSSGYEFYQICLFLWHQVLFDDPASKSRRRGPLSHWDCLPPEKSLYTRPAGKGIVIGNLTSQLVSNIYLDQLDHFVKYTLGYKYYGRYVDDFFIIVPAAEYQKAKRDVARIEAFLSDELDLTLHPKKRYFESVYKGVPFLGVRIYPHCLYPSNRLQRKLKHNLHKLDIGEYISIDTLVSYFGHLRHLNGDKYLHHLFDKYGFDFDLYLESKSDDRRPLPDIIKEMKKKHQNKNKNSSDGDDNAPVVTRR